MANHAFLIAIIALPFAGSLAAAFLPTHTRSAPTWLAGIVAVLCLGLTIGFGGTVLRGGIVRTTISWLPEQGLDIALRMDGFAWMFCLLVTGIGLLVVMYARYYMAPADPLARFLAFLLAFMGAMLGVVLSGNLLLLVFFWELTSLFSFLLIGYWHQNAAARDGARMALTVTGIGGLALLVGVLLIGRITGSYDLDVVLASGDLIRGHDLYLPALVLVLLGALTKSAQFPFHFWLPNAMAAPTPVSAYLHSATMVKVGVFLLARLWPALAGTEPWFWIVATTGLATLLIGAFIAIFQQDLKGLLAYSTISHLGLITLLLGLDSPLAAVAAVFHIFNHALFKASLFMAAGVIDHECGTRDMRRLSGLFRFMPVTATLAMVAAAAMAGVPLLNGFLSKEMFFAETIEMHDNSLLDRNLPYFATVAGIFSVAYSLRFIYKVFFGSPPRDLPRQPHEPPRWMRFPIEFLVLACLVVGIVPGRTVGPILDAAVNGVLGAETPAYSLAVWHGFTWALLMSAVALAGGIALYLVLRRYLLGRVDGVPVLRHLNSQRIFEQVMVAVSWRWARQLEGVAGTRRLQPQLRLIVFAAIAAASWPLYRQGIAPGTARLSGFDPSFALLWAVGAACAVGAAYQAKYHRIAALILMGGAGLATCITFVWLSAPDLALTQLLVEIVTTVLLLLGVRWLPRRIAEIDAAEGLRARLRRARDLALAVAGGLGVAGLAYAVMTRPPVASISGNLLERAYSEGGGTNVVNVILVDFRGFDTLGEITVLGIVALTVYALLRRFRPAPESVGLPEQQRRQDAWDDGRDGRRRGDTVADYLLVPTMVMRPLFPVIGMLAAYLFLRGHDLPGGGFVAGLTMALAFILQYMVGGTAWVEARLRILPVRWIGLGLLTATATGAGAWLFGHPFLTSYFAYAELPLIGKVPTASALLFDLGVFLLVVGATVLVLIALAHQSVRARRSPRPAAEPAPEGSGGAG